MINYNKYVEKEGQKLFRWVKYIFFFILFVFEFFSAIKIFLIWTKNFKNSNNQNSK